MSMTDFFILKGARSKIRVYRTEAYASDLRLAGRKLGTQVAEERASAAWVHNPQVFLQEAYYGSLRLARLNSRFDVEFTSRTTPSWEDDFLNNL